MVKRRNQSGKQESRKIIEVADSNLGVFSLFPAFLIHLFCELPCGKLRVMADDRPALCSCGAGSHLMAVSNESTVTKCWEESPNTIRQHAA
jgi:hypothetical protein